MNAWEVLYRSRYHPMEGEYSKIVRGYMSKKDIRTNWHNIIETDEFKITKIQKIS